MTENKLSIAVDATMQQIIKVIEKEKCTGNLQASFMEITINKIEYQVQLSFISDKKIWVDADEVRNMQVTKIHF